MKKLLFIVACLICFTLQNVVSQTVTNVEALKLISKTQNEKWDRNRIEVLEYAKENNVPIRIETEDMTMEMQYINQFGMPEYYTTTNVDAAATISTDRVHSGGGAGLSLEGSGMTVHEWDGGGVLTTHQEFGSRVTQGDSPSGTNYHSTHVAGTLIASGVDSDAKGMAPSANLRAFDWNSDNGEMAWEAANGALVSNHSYGLSRGWTYVSQYGEYFWYGTTSVSTTEDYLFGFYDENAYDWDQIAYYAPYYLITKSAGNDRGDDWNGGHYVYSPGVGWIWSTASRDPDGGTSGYDCIGSQGAAKNILTVGAVDDIPGGYTQPSDVSQTNTDFSSWGPVDDGRIKPDVVANGYGLYSTLDDNNSAYASYSGTSMASPNAAGSMILLQEHYENLNGAGIFMRSATLKALVIHTADEAGSNDGPDYEFGWGLMNTESAAAKITEDQTTDVITEHVLADGESFTRDITTTGTDPIRVTVVWTDPPGTIPSAAVDPSDVILVNDLDLNVEDVATRTVHYPWRLRRNNPSSAALRNNQNNRDNVQMVDIDSPSNGTTYTITVDHDGSLTGGSQAFSMIISGNIDNTEVPEADFYASNTTPGVDEEIRFTDASINLPDSWLWSISPATHTYLNGTSALSQNPQVEFTATGTYDVTLYVENAEGNDTEVKTGYITVSSAPASYCESYSTNPYGYISNVNIGSISNSSTYTNVGGADPNDKYYEDYTSLSTDVTMLQSYSLTVSNGTSDTDLDLSVWVDWNRDGDFYDDDEQIVCEIDGSGAGTFSVNVPAGAQLGATRMRIRTNWYENCFPCSSTLNGEVEDYTLNIEAGDLTWDGSESTDWDDPDNWDGGAVPTSSFNVIIPNAASVPNSPVISNGTTATCANLTLQTGASLTSNGELTLTGE